MRHFSQVSARNSAIPEPRPFGSQCPLELANEKAVSERDEEDDEDQAIADEVQIALSQDEMNWVCIHGRVRAKVRFAAATSWRAGLLSLCYFPFNWASNSSIAARIFSIAIRMAESPANFAGSVHIGATAAVRGGVGFPA